MYLLFGCLHGVRLSPARTGIGAWVELWDLELWPCGLHNEPRKTVVRAIGLRGRCNVLV